MVEVAGGNQQLKTQYSGTVGKHAEAGGEISRDEVPLIYRDFVQQYFEQVRKTPPPAKTRTAEVTRARNRPRPPNKHGQYSFQAAPGFARSSLFASASS